MRTGMLLDAATGDLLIVSKSLQVGQTKDQNQVLILICQPGEIKEHPTLGVGVENYLNDEHLLELEWEVRLNFEQDNMRVKSFDIVNTSIKIEAE